MAHAARRDEIKRNFRAFEDQLASLLQANAGRFALFSKGELQGVFGTPVDALLEGNERFGDGKFSVQRITKEPLDLGFLSYASGERDTR
jgi:hypothetical protein